MGRHIAVGVFAGLWLCLDGAGAQDIAPDSKAPEEGLRKMLVEPGAERPAFPRVDAPSVTLGGSRPAVERYDPTRPAEKLRLQDVDPRKTDYTNGPVNYLGVTVCTWSELGRETRDVLARDILRQLAAAHRPLAVVWLFDRSRSLRDERASVRQKLEMALRDLRRADERVQEVVQKLGPLPQPAPDVVPLVSHLVGGFGESFQLLTPTPTTDTDVVLDTFDGLAVDPSGVENTFHAIAGAIREARLAVSQGTRLLVVVVTDESGNDDSLVEDCLEAARSDKIPIYVLGRQALFGMALARLQPADGGICPTIRRGPESADIEVLAWDGLQPRDDEQPSGFAPYALARLARDTGGIYFLLPAAEIQRVRQPEKAYSFVALRDYVPDYDSRSADLARRERSALRRALHDAVQATRDLALPLHFPFEPRPLVESLTDAADQAERQRRQLVGLEARLRALRDERAAEPSKRWQAHYDLTLAQLVAFQVTLCEYRAALLDLRRNVGAAEAWTVAHGRTRHAPEPATEAGYQEAERLLKEVIDRHPSTPWADLAQTIRDRGLSVELRDAGAGDEPRPQAPGNKYY